jgi:hypothetical protein
MDCDIPARHDDTETCDQGFFLKSERPPEGPFLRWEKAPNENTSTSEVSP